MISFSICKTWIQNFNLLVRYNIHTDINSDIKFIE